MDARRWYFAEQGDKLDWRNCVVNSVYVRIVAVKRVEERSGTLFSSIMPQKRRSKDVAPDYFLSRLFEHPLILSLVVALQSQ